MLLLCYAIIGIIVEFFIKSNNVDDKLRFTVESGSNEKIKKNAMDAKEVGQKFYRCGNDINFHVRNKVMSYVMLTDSVSNIGKAGTHKVENEAIGN